MYIFYPTYYIYPDLTLHLPQKTTAPEPPVCQLYPSFPLSTNIIEKLSLLETFVNYRFKQIALYFR